MCRCVCVCVCVCGVCINLDAEKWRSWALLVLILGPLVLVLATIYCCRLVLRRRGLSSEAK